MKNKSRSKKNLRKQLPKATRNRTVGDKFLAMTDSAKKKLELGVKTLPPEWIEVKRMDGVGGRTSFYWHVMSRIVNVQTNRLNVLYECSATQYSSRDAARRSAKKLNSKFRKKLPIFSL